MGDPMSDWDPVLRPLHYARHKYETWDVIIDWGLSYCLGNVVKYISRAGHKGDRLEDLRKAMQYLSREIAMEERKRDEQI